MFGLTKGLLKISCQVDRVGLHTMTIVCKRSVVSLAGLDRDYIEWTLRGEYSRSRVQISWDT